MDLESEVSPIDSLEKNESLDTESSQNNGEIDAKSNDNGKYDAENGDTKPSDDVKDDVTVEKTTEVSPARTKGRGLRKWRRIRREAGKETNGSLDSNRKRNSTAFPAGMKQKSEESSSSTNAVSNALDHNRVFVDIGLMGKGPDFSSRADSENSEDRNSRSSTAASAPRMKNLETVRSLSGKNSGISVQSSGQHGKSQSVTNKKARGVRIKKENSYSSVESDSRSSNFVFLQGGGNSNGGQSCRLVNYDEDYSDDGENGDRCLNEEGSNAFSKNEADSEDVSREDLGGENSWEVKEEKVDDGVELRDRDDLVESVVPLHLAQQALEREVQKLRDVGKDEDTLSDDTNISNLESMLNFEKMKIDHEELLKQRIAAEVEFLVISKSIQNLKLSCKDQTELNLQQKKISSVATRKEAEEDVKVDEGEMARKLRKMVWKYGFWFMIQLVLFLVAVYLLVSQFSSPEMEVLPT